jgi:hypothetical protein
VTPPETAPNELARCLADLEKLGLGRPANASIAEYLQALTAERVIDSETSALVCAPYQRLQYGSGDADAVDVRQASERLRNAVVAIGQTSDQARGLIAARIQKRLLISSAEGTAPPNENETESTDFGVHFERSEGASSDEAGDLPSSADDHTPEPKNSGRRGQIRINSIPLETVALAAVGLVVGGYILRGGTEQAITSGKADASGSKRAKVAAADVWKHEDYWAANLKRRALTEAASKRERSARLAYELLISEMPKDPDGLNDLAWLYLTSEDQSLRNPQRGLELALRAVAVSRAPAILDTAAEARYQTGDADAAVKLELEAIQLLPRLGGFQTQMEGTLRQQLAKFQRAAKSSSSQAKSSSP